MADDDIVEDFIIFLLEMSIAFCIMFQYNTKFQIYCKYLSQLKKNWKSNHLTDKHFSCVHAVLEQGISNVVYETWDKDKTSAAGAFDLAYY